MLIDSRKIDQNSVLQADVCIVGAGAVGIVLAHALIRSGLEVIVLESGGMKMAHRTQWLYQTKNLGLHKIDVEFTKQRYYGGASNKWFGRCRPLDPIDFEVRDWVPYSGWPFGLDVLEKYYAEAQDILDLGPNEYTAKYWETETSRDLSAIQGDRLDPKVFQFSPPTRLGPKYLPELEQADNIKLYLYANAVNVGLHPDGGHVDEVACATLSGKRFKVQAHQFVLAASGLENARLLLASDGVQRAGVGNQNDQVGRYFMDHPHAFVGRVTELHPHVNLTDLGILDYDLETGNTGTVAAVGLGPDIMRNEGLLNATGFLVKRPWQKGQDVYHSKGAVALQRIGDMLGHRLPPSPTALAGNVWQVVTHAGGAAGMLAATAQNVWRRDEVLTLRLQVETAPNPDSRITLRRRRDPLGMPKAQLDWRMTELDRYSVARTTELLIQGLKLNGIVVEPIRGDLDEAGWIVSMRSGYHHMGVTRMAADPKLGVVDANSRVHGVDNLYVAGSGVFSTGGMANPMLTAVALTRRLADRLRNKLA